MILQRRLKVWRAANGPGWIGHVKNLAVIEGYGPQWFGGLMIWDEDWSTCVRRGLELLRT